MEDWFCVQRNSSHLSRPLEKGRAKGRGLQCLEEAQSIVAGFTSSVSDLLPVIPYVRFTILQSSAPSGQSIPAFGRPLLQGGTRFKFISMFCGVSFFLRRTFPAEPVEPTEPAEPFSHAIHGRPAPRANPEP